MPSTRKQKATEHLSRQPDVMSDLEDMNVMLGNFPWIGYENESIQREIEEVSVFGGLEDKANELGEDNRSLLNWNS